MSLEMPNFLSSLKNYFEPEPPLLRSAKTIQILLIRETHDFTAFRTEAGDELNVVTLPKGKTDPTPVLRVAMLASKQKAVENRMFISNVRTLAKDNGVKIDEKQEECALKDALCRKCPRCILFGAVSVEKGQEGRWNIKHRIEYSSAYSLEAYEDIAELITWNAVSDPTQSTGQALGVTENIQPVVHFPSVVTLISPTWEEFVMVVKTLIATKSYGAETRIKGDMVNHIVGIIGGYEEAITSLDLLLELSDRELKGDIYKSMEEILSKYGKFAAFEDKLTIITNDKLENLISSIQKFVIDKKLIQRMYDQASSFTDKAEKTAGEEKKKS
ncbi:MAG: type I-D CRISPR-associated protein Cas7/Csc2 [Candidatus Jordarchaeum sp.]|uniref:type I-D CRISPR-associated protein Cas7/Csc2 n=1 Tax=Candidatus Jordarchaeum sp. TaxID=2823881 RepID=UPI00404A02EF